MRYAVTGANGQLARLVATRILDAVAPGDVVLVSRRPEALGEFADRGADVREGDFDRPDTLARAFAGVDRLLLVSTDAEGTRLGGHRAAIDAAVRAGVAHVLYTSVPEPVAGNPAGVVPDHAATEEALRASGLTWTMLRNNLYAHMQLPGVVQAARAGALYSNTGDGRAAYVTREDCAAVAAAALVQDGHADRAYDVTGPQALSNRDLAALAGPQVQVVDLDDGAYRAALGEGGLPPAVVELVVSFGAAIREGFLATVAPTVQDLTGVAPTPLADLVVGVAAP